MRDKNYHLPHILSYIHLQGFKLLPAAPCDPFYWHGLTTIKSCMSNYNDAFPWDVITQPFSNGV